VVTKSSQGRVVIKNMSREYLKLGRPTNTCQACGTPLGALAHHPSVVPAEPAGDDEPERRDYCPACWTRLREEGYFSFWLSQRREKGQRRRFRRRLVIDVLTLLLRNDLSVRDAEQKPAKTAHVDQQRQGKVYRSYVATGELPIRLFIVAHLLHTFHGVEWKGEVPRESGRPTRLRFLMPGDPTPIDVEDCRPSTEEIEAVRTQVIHLLEQAQLVTPEDESEAVDV